VSKNGPPTVRFIWGKLDYFLDHVERGRRRLARERDAPLCSEREAGPELRKTDALGPPISQAQMATDLERLFGARWRGDGPR
jgi:hypothetical protein